MADARPGRKKPSLRKQTATPLQESRDLLQLALEVGGMFAWEYDLQTGQVLLSEQAETRLGLASGAFGGTFNDLLAFVHPADRAALEQEIKHAGQEATPIEVECRMLRPNGGVYWNLVKGRWYCDPQGRPLGCRNINLDITAHKQADADAHFLAQLSKRLRRNDEAKTLTREVAQAVGEYLQVQHCFFTENDLAHDRFIIHQDYCDGALMMANAPALSLFNPYWAEMKKIGQTQVLRDVTQDERAVDDAGYQQFGIGAFVSVPLMRDGQMIAALTSITATARNWQPREIALLETVAELTWQVLERLRSEANLRQQDERLRNILNSIEEVVWSVSPDATEVYFISPAATHIYGRTPADFYANGKLWLDTLHPDDRAIITSAFESLSENGRFDVEYRIVRSDGAIRWLHDRGYYVRAEDGQPLRLDGVASDITNRKQAQAALQVNEVRFSAVINSAMDAIISVDEQQRIVLFNPAAERMFGYRAAEMLGQSLERLLPTHLRATHAERIRQFGQTDTTARAMGALGTVSGVRRSGEEFPIEAAISQIEENGEKLYTVILRDIARRKAAEVRLREQAALLDHACEAITVVDAGGRIVFWNRGAERLYGWTGEEVMGRNLHDQIFRGGQAQSEAARHSLLTTGEWVGELQECTKDGKEIVVESHCSVVRNEAGQHESTLIINTDITAKKELESQFLRAQRLESIGTLASGIAHDLNNILSPLTMGLQLLQLKLQDEQSQRLLHVMQANVSRGTEMIKQVLSFAKGLSGARVRIQPKHLIRELSRIVTETFPRNITMQQRLSDDLWVVDGDATQLHQVLLNLCVNAGDAMPQGGTLTISAENKVLDTIYANMLKGASVGPFVVLTVADTGMGMSPELLARIFDPFFTTKEPGKGTGLGLATVQSIVTRHGGFVQVESKPGAGTKFHLWLPAQATATAVVAPSAPATLPTGQGELILIVDDEAAIREMMRTTLESYGYRTLTAEDGVTALQLFAQQADEIKVVLTDMMMPMMDGLVLIRTLQKIKPHMSFIASSGLTETEKVEEACRLGVRHVLSKPYDLETLLTTLARALRPEG